MNTTKMDRRSWLKQFGLTVTGSAIGVRWAHATFQDQRRDLDELYSEQVERAIERGIEYLHTRKIPEGGFATAGWGQNVAVCGLVGLSLLGRGYRPGIGPHGELIEHVGRFVLQCSQDSGYLESLGKSSHGPMYEHGFGTLFLAEYYGASQVAAVRERLSRAVKLILRAQNKNGGWRYEPAPVDADLSVTVCQIMALRAARNAGFAVPSETIDRAIDYVKRSQNSDGGFMYQLTGGESRAPLTAAAVVAMYNAGLDGGPELEQGIAFLESNVDSIQSMQRNAYFFYAHYYSVQAFWHRGGDAWKKWYRRLRDTILNMQERDGSWFDNNSSEYGTAMACLILNMPRSVLPIFQR